MKLVKESITDHLKGKNASQIRTNYFRHINDIVDKAMVDYADSNIAVIPEDKDNVNVISKFLFDEMGITFSDFYFDRNYV